LRARDTPESVSFTPVTSLICPGTRPVVDHDALAEAQVGNVLLARDLLRGRRRGQGEQHETAKQ